VTGLYPAALLACLYATWFEARKVLGHWPRPSLDDPKGVAGIDLPYGLTRLFLGGLPFGLILNLGLLLAWGVSCGAARKLSFRSCWWVIVFCGAIWAAGLLFLYTDPFRALDWLLD
jgi:hypothetical protein